MPNKDNLNNPNDVVATLTFAAAMVKGDIVKVTANNTVDKAVATDVPRGEVQSYNANLGTGAVRLRGRAVVEILANGNIAANTEVKMSSLSGSEQRVAAWVQGTDNENLKVGWVLQGGNGVVIKVVLY